MGTKELAIQILKSAEMVFSLQDYTSATVLYFKAWFVIQDYMLLIHIGHSPKDHTERFRLLETEFPEIYALLNNSFLIYRNSYSKIINKKICEQIREVVRNEFSRYQITNEMPGIP